MVGTLFFVAAFLAEVIGTVAGFGSSTVFLPLALFFLDFRTALVLVAFFHIFGNAGRLTFFRKGIDRKLLLAFGVPSVLATVVGASLVAYAPQETLKLVLGAFLLLFSVTSFHNGYRIKQTKNALVTGGALSGFFAGLIGTGGALRGAFLNALGAKKDTYIPTAAVVAIAVDLTRIPIYLANGFLTQQYYAYLPVLFVIALLGSFTGRSIVNRIPQKKFRKVVLVAIALTGLKFISDSLRFFA